jgi:HAD superfamily hydrolase (TIGR01509 family)
MQAVVFDFDGVIVDSEILHDEALRAVCSPLGISWEAHPWVGWPDADVLHEVFRRRGESLARPRLDELLRVKTAVVLEQVHAGRYTPYPGVLELLRDSARVARVGVCSAGLRDQITPVLEHFGVLPLLSALVAYEDTARSKPDPEPYALTAHRLDVNPARSIAIEDSPRGVASARAAGFTVVAVGHTSPRDALSHAHHFAPSTTSLTLSTLQSLIHHT